jgi:hypothetical protein
VECSILLLFIHAGYLFMFGLDIGGCGGEGGWPRYLFYFTLLISKLHLCKSTCTSYEQVVATKHCNNEVLLSGTWSKV